MLHPLLIALETGMKCKQNIPSLKFRLNRNPPKTSSSEKNKITVTVQHRAKDRDSEWEKAKEKWKSERERQRLRKMKVEAWGKRMIKRNRLKRGVQEIDLWGLKSNCNGIVFPPISSTASKLLIDRREMRPPIPGAHPAVTVQDGHQEEGEITQHMWGPFLFCSQSQSQSQIPKVGSCLVPQLNKIISFWTARPLIKLL